MRRRGLAATFVIWIILLGTTCGGGTDTQTAPTPPQPTPVAQPSPEGVSRRPLKLRSVDRVRVDVTVNTQGPASAGPLSFLPDVCVCPVGCASRGAVSN